MMLLCSQNDNQGLGFTLGGTVINRQFLSS